MRELIFNTETPRHRGFLRVYLIPALLSLSLCLGASMVKTFAQETIPSPGAPRSAAIPGVKEITLKNGLTIAVAEKHHIPLVTVQLLVKNGAGREDRKLAGLANLTASLLTKGTKTRSATQIAEEIEFLGGSIFSFAGWQN